MAVLTNFGLNLEGADEGATLMPKLQYRFRVTFENMGGSNDGPLVTKNVVSVTRPALDHDDITIDTYNSKIRLAGKHMWQDITLVLRDDADSNVVAMIGKQMSRQVNHNDQVSRRAGSNYKFKMKIEMLDGSNSGTGVLDTWELAGCFIPGIQYGDLNYGSSEIVQVTATIRYDNASHLVDGEDTMSSGSVSNLRSTAT